MVRLKNCRDFSLLHTFTCGQCFRFAENADGSFTGVVRDKVLTLYEQGTDVVIDGIDEREYDTFFKNYFDMDTDYEQIRDSLKSVCAQMIPACDYAPGIRILRQEPFETLISFIISQNNNIPRIKGLIERLCAHCGTPLGGRFYAFPTPEQLCGVTEETLREKKFGFRAKYITDAAAKVCSGEVDLQQIGNMDTDEARKQLMRICGVGQKVADCTLLFGFYKTDVFPVDVWIKRALAVVLGGADIAVFRENAGFAQQYLFTYTREHKLV